MRRKRWFLIATAVTLLGVIIYNATVELPVLNARSDEHGVTMVAYHRWLISPSTLVIDLWSIDGKVSMADVDRNLFEAAEALKGQTFGNVILAFRGKGRFIIDGAQFKTTGEERKWQNPIYAIRTLPQNLRKMDGSPAFETWEGGLLGVLGQQLKDHEEFHAQWYARESLGLPESTPLGQ